MGGVSPITVALFVGAVALAAVAHTSFNQGKIAGQKEQAERNLKDYRSIVEAVNEDTLDPTDYNAVTTELCRMAGLPAGDELCAMRGDTESAD